jgi:hypothetical protein
MKGPRVSNVLRRVTRLTEATAVPLQSGGP